MTCDLVEVQRVFEMFNRDGDSHITWEDMTDSLERLGMVAAGDELTDVITCIDADRRWVCGHGRVHKAVRHRHAQQLACDEEADMREAFNMFDQNGDRLSPWMSCALCWCRWG
jgi:Ca2+-binding EF-hand superfamily protein